jgi:hypothetical protein
MPSSQVDSWDICEAPVYNFSTGKIFLSWEHTNTVSALSERTFSGLLLERDQNIQDVVVCVRCHTMIKK